MNDSVMEKSSIPESQTPSSSLLSYTLFALGLALIIRFFILAPYVVEGDSMDPTFQDWNYLIVDRIVYKLDDPQRGDVIVFKYPPDPSRSLIKRVIGLPGERVAIDGGVVTIYNTENPEGFVIDEPYVTTENATYDDNVNVSLDTDEYFVMGDNRKVSADSRLWGELERSEIVGRADLRLFPLSSIDFLPGLVRYKQ